MDDFYGALEGGVFAQVRLGSLVMHKPIAVRATLRGQAPTFVATRHRLCEWGSALMLGFNWLE